MPGNAASIFRSAVSFAAASSEWHHTVTSCPERLRWQARAMPQAPQPIIATLLIICLPFCGKSAVLNDSNYS